MEEEEDVMINRHSSGMRKQWKQDTRQVSGLQCECPVAVWFWSDTAPPRGRSPVLHERDFKTLDVFNAKFHCQHLDL